MQHLEVEFESGRKVILRKFQIRDIDMASMAASKRAGESQFMFSMALQKEMLKLLLVSVDGKDVAGVDREQLDKILDPSEYMALLQEVQAQMGNAPIKAKGFVATSGDK